MNKEILFQLRQVRKTYGVGRIPTQVFRECRLDDPPCGDWRSVCGNFEVCRRECPRCWALHIDALDVPSGTTLGILGHSGSGKTTLLYALACLFAVDSDSGTFTITAPRGSEQVVLDLRDGVWIDHSGQRVKSQSIRSQLFSFVFQAGYLSSHLTALWNVGLALAMRGESKEQIFHRSRSALSQMDLRDGRQRALPRHLSGGEYQRVAVARALAKNPACLFADEPTGNLDPVNARLVMNMLRDWKNRNPANTLVLVTHNLELASEFCDNLVVLRGGKIVLTGSPAQLSEQDLNHALQGEFKSGSALLPKETIQV